MLYQELLEQLNGKKSKNIRYKTKLLINQNGTIFLKHHDTLILEIKPNNAIRVNNGGWYSSTTKSRLNNILRKTGINIFSHRGNWIVSDNTDTYPYNNNMVFLNGQLIQELE